jgi:hypothetical protein
MEDKMRMQTLHELGLGAKAIIAKYPSKQWKLSTVKKFREKSTMKPKTIAHLKLALQSIWEDLPQGPINLAINSFTKRLQACVTARGGHIEHLM